MGRIKCKIVCNQVWTVENLTKEKYYIINWDNYPIKK
jgi:hypothetical protein